VRRLLPFFVAAVLGPAAALLVSCGDRSSLIPGDNANRLKADLENVRSALLDGKCDRAAQAAAQMSGDSLELPTTVDQRLQQRVQEGVNALQNQVPEQCVEGKTTDTTDTQTETTDTATETTTTDTTTETTPTTDTTTTDTNPLPIPVPEPTPPTAPTPPPSTGKQTGGGITIPSPSSTPSEGVG
jgi:hypothetical protein